MGSVSPQRGNIQHLWGQGDYPRFEPEGTAEQLELFSSPSHAVSAAMDRINDRWGEFVVTPALLMGMEDIILDRISFGGVKELAEIYE